MLRRVLAVNPEAEVAAGEKRVAARKKRERAAERRHYPSSHAEGDVWTPMRSLGDCPGCDARLNATYSVVKRRGVAWHVGCDPEPDPLLCARCGAPDCESGIAGQPVCADCWPLVHQVVCFTERLQYDLFPPRLPKAFR